MSPDNNLPNNHSSNCPGGEPVNKIQVSRSYRDPEDDNGDDNPHPDNDYTHLDNHCRDQGNYYTNAEVIFY